MNRREGFVLMYGEIGDTYNEDDWLANFGIYASGWVDGQADSVAEAGKLQTEIERLQNTIQAKASTIELRKLEIEVYEREVERLQEKHMDEIHSLCGVIGQTASCLRGPNRAVRQVAINAIEHHECHDWIVEYGLSEPMKPDRLIAENERLREALRSAANFFQDDLEHVDGHMMTICDRCMRDLRTSKHKFDCPFKLLEEEDHELET